MRRAALSFIFVTAMLDMLAFGIMIPVLPRLVESFVHGDVARAARIYGWFGTLWAAMQFLCSPLLGALSDRFGRRPVILISCFGLGTDFFFMALAPSVGWLLLGRAISGMSSASISVSGAYVADITPEAQRARAFGILAATFGIGFVLGPAVGGLLGAISPRLPFWFAGGLSLLNALYGLLVLPESLPRERRLKHLSWTRTNPIGSLTLLRSHAELLGLASMNFLYQLAHYVLPSTVVLYAGYRYHWDTRAVGMMMALTGISSMIVQSMVVRPVVAGLGERRMLLVGLLFGVLGFIGFGLARSGGAFLLTVPLLSLMGLFAPGLQALMSRRVTPHEQGQLQGANSCLVGIAGLIGPQLFTRTFAHFIDPTGTLIPGAPFLLAALLLAIALGLGVRVTRGADANSARLARPPAVSGAD